MPAIGTIYQSRPGRHRVKTVLCDKLGATISELAFEQDGRWVDLCRSKRATFTRNRPGPYEFEVKSNHPLLAAAHTDGKRKLSKQIRTIKLFREELPIGGTYPDDLTWVIRGNYWVQNIEHSGGEDDYVTRVSCWDPMQRLAKLHCRDVAEDLPLGLVSWNDSYPSYIIRRIINRAQLSGRSVGIYIPNPANNYPRTQRIDFNVHRIKVWDAIRPLIDGYNLGVDIYLQPLDRTDGMMTQLRLRDPLGEDVSATVGFVWGKAPFSAQEMVWLESGDATVNDAVFIGRSLTDHSVKFVNVQDAPSLAARGPYEDLRIYPDLGDLDLLSGLATAEVAFAHSGQDVISFTPTPKLAPDPWNDMWLGDVVALEADAKLAGGFDALARVQQVTVAWPDDGGEVIEQVSTSKDPD